MRKKIQLIQSVTDRSANLWAGDILREFAANVPGYYAAREAQKSYSHATLHVPASMGFLLPEYIPLNELRDITIDD